MSVKRRDVWRPWSAKGGEATPRAFAGSDRASLVCPLIPSRMKYTCSGRCKGCNPTTAETGAGTAGGAGESERGE